MESVSVTNSIGASRYASTVMSERSLSYADNDRLFIYTTIAGLSSTYQSTNVMPATPSKLAPFFHSRTNETLTLDSQRYYPRDHTNHGNVHSYIVSIFLIIRSQSLVRLRTLWKKWILQSKNYNIRFELQCLKYHIMGKFIRLFFYFLLFLYRLYSTGDY